MKTSGMWYLADMYRARATRAEAELKTLRERVARIDGLQRYDLDRGSGYGCGCTMERAHDGEFVVFDDLEELGLAALEAKPWALVESDGGDDDDET